MSYCRVNETDSDVYVVGEHTGYKQQIFLVLEEQSDVPDADVADLVTEGGSAELVDSREEGADEQLVV